VNRLVDSTADHKGSTEGVATGAFTPIFLNLFLSDVKYLLIILRSYLSIWLIAFALVVRILCDRCNGETGFESCGSMTVVRAARVSSYCLASSKDVSRIDCGTFATQCVSESSESYTCYGVLDEEVRKMLSNQVTLLASTFWVL
jgi:hypothetical protein